MYTRIALLVPLLLFVTGAVAQKSSGTSSGAPTPSSPAGLDPCIQNCSQQAATSAGCGSFTNVTCVCTSTEFQTQALQCLQKNCTEADVQAALGLQSQLCGNASPSGSGSSAAGTGTATAPAGSATGTSGASTSGSAAGTSGASASGSAPAGSGAASGTSSPGAAVGIHAYNGFLGKQLDALAVAGFGAILGGFLVL